MENKELTDASTMSNIVNYYKNDGISLFDFFDIHVKGFNALIAYINALCMKNQAKGENTLFILLDNAEYVYFKNINYKGYIDNKRIFAHVLNKLISHIKDKGYSVGNTEYICDKGLGFYIKW
jgi:hypothetical protein